MPYYVRAFCTAASPPTINTVLQYLRERGSEFAAQAVSPSELESSAWEQFDLIYNPGKGPIVVECIRDEGEDSSAKAECAEFIEEVEGLDESPGRTEVVDHLRKTRFIISSQLLSDIDDSGYEANGQFLEYFVDHCAALIQADGEGFYRRMDLDELLLPLK